MHNKMKSLFTSSKVVPKTKLKIDYKNSMFLLNFNRLLYFYTNAYEWDLITVHVNNLAYKEANYSWKNIVKDYSGRFLFIIFVVVTF